MLKSKIARRLSLNFAVALIVFSLIMGIVFMILFRSQTINIHESQLEYRAKSIANTLSDYSKNGNRMGGYGAYLRFLGDISDADVWIIDSGFNLTTCGNGKAGMNHNYSYKELPPNAEKLIEEVFKDKTVFSQDFSSVLTEPTLTVGVPIKNGIDVIGVVLLHTPVHGVDEAVNNGFIILGFSTVLALIIAILLSIIFSYYFTKPLNKMKNNAVKLGKGDYSAINRINQNDEIGELADTLDILALRLFEARLDSLKLEQLRKDFVANVSHELKTPITVIRGSLEALLENIVTEPEKVKEFHLQMLSEVVFLQRLVGDLLDLSRLQNQDFAIEKTEISLAELMEDIKRSALQLAEKKAVKIVTIEKTSLCNIIGDYGRLRQMFMIILDNAVKFSADNGLVTIELNLNKITIKDEGCGISSEDLPYIFERFYKSRIEENKSGTGLGLAIAKQIADRHDISLYASSKLGEGTEFVFEFNNYSK